MWLYVEFSSVKLSCAGIALSCVQCLVSHVLAGSVDMFLLVLQPTNEIVAHVKQLTTSNVAVNDVTTGSVIGVADVTTEASPLEWMVIRTEQTLNVDDVIKVHVEFTGWLEKDLYGIYYSDYTNDQGDTV